MGYKKDTHVIVTVDTDGINEQNKNDMVIFSDNRGVPPSKPGYPDDFISTVDMGRKIKWIGKVKDPVEDCEDLIAFYKDNLVEIKEISIKKEFGCSKILKKNYYYDRNNSGEVVGFVRKGEKCPEEIIAEKIIIEGYNITIRVNGKDWYTIDPQMELVW